MSDLQEVQGLQGIQPLQEIRREQETEPVWTHRTKRTHRIGTITFGLMLVGFGVGFLLHIINPEITYFTVWQFWPCTLISLGIEVLISTFYAEKAKYDGWAIALCFLIVFFSMGLAGTEFLFDYWDRFF